MSEFVKHDVRICIENPAAQILHTTSGGEVAEFTADDEEGIVSVSIYEREGRPEIITTLRAQDGRLAVLNVPVDHLCALLAIASHKGGEELTEYIDGALCDFREVAKRDLPKPEQMPEPEEPPAYAHHGNVTFVRKWARC